MHQYVRISDTSEIRRFIRDLKEALKHAKQNAGGYSAFLHDEDDRMLLQIEIAPKVRPKK